MTDRRTDLPARKEPRRRLVVGLAALALLALLVGVVSAQSSASYDLSWYSLDGGSRVVNSDSYRLASTLGQSIIGWATGTEYALGAGYLPGLPETGFYPVYLPLVCRP